MSTRKIFAGIVALVAAFAVVSTVNAQSALTSNLTVGSAGAEVVALQSFLEMKGHLVMPAGVAKGTFGPLTQSSVAKFQMANGITPAAGYVGPVTRAAINAQMTGSTGGSTGGNNQGGCPTGYTAQMYNGMSVCVASGSNNNGGSNNSGSLSGEADVSFKSFKSGNDSELEEGQEDGEVAEITFDVEDGDFKVERMDIIFDASNVVDDADNEPWKVFAEAKLWVDGEEVANVDTSDEDSWSDDYNDDSDLYRLRFSGIDTTFEADEEGEIVLSLSADSTVEDKTDADWEIYLESDAIRGIDGAGIDDEIGGGSTVSVTFVDAGQDDELTISESDDNPDATTLLVDEDEKSEWHTVLVFELEADETDIVIDSLPMSVTVATGETYNAMVDDIEVEIDGDIYDDVSVTGGATNAATVLFDLDDDVTIEANDTVTAEVRVKLTKVDGSNYDEGDTISVDISSTNVDNIDAEGVDNLDSTQLKGSADGDTFTLRSTGVQLKEVSSSFDADTRENLDTTLTDDEGVYTIVFGVTAFEDDAFVELTAARSAATSSVGANYTIEDANGAVTALGTVNATLERVSGGTVSGNFVKISDGASARFRLKVYYDPAATGDFRLQLNHVGFADASSTSADTWETATPEENYETAKVNIKN